MPTASSSSKLSLQNFGKIEFKLALLSLELGKRLQWFWQISYLVLMTKTTVKQTKIDYFFFLLFSKTFNKYQFFCEYCFLLNNGIFFFSFALFEKFVEARDEKYLRVKSQFFSVEILHIKCRLCMQSFITIGQKVIEISVQTDR